MKNILAENMLRFGPKNLSESDRRNLQRLMEQVNKDVISLLITDSYESATSGNPTIIQDDAKYVFFDTVRGGKKYAFESGKLVVERNFADTYTIAAGIPGTLDENNKFTAGNKLMIYSFQGEPVNIPTDPATGEPQGNVTIGENEMVRSLTKYYGNTKSGIFNAAQIAYAATSLASFTLPKLWPKLVNFINKMVEIQLSTAIADTDKNSVYQQYVANGGTSKAGSSF